MPLNIKSAETDRLARELAAETGETLTEAVRRALAERLERCRRRGPKTRRLALRELRERVSTLPRLDARTDDEILGYSAVDGTLD
jgi:antitoxin VapB